MLGDASNVKASRQKQGPFENLDYHPEFRDLVLVTPAPVLQRRDTPPSQGLVPTPTHGDRHRPMKTPTPAGAKARPSLRDGPSHASLVTRSGEHSSISSTKASLPYLPVRRKARNSEYWETVAWTMLAALIGGGGMWLFLQFFR
jgi:hypothetical protein